MRNRSSVLILTLICGLFAMLPVFAADAADYQKSLLKTQETLSDVAQKAQLWTTSGDLLRQATTAATTGDYDLAIKLLDEAKLHGELAVATAEREKNTWQNSVPR